MLALISCGPPRPIKPEDKRNCELFSFNTDPNLFSEQTQRACLKQIAHDDPERFALALARAWNGENQWKIRRILSQILLEDHEWFGIAYNIAPHNWSASKAVLEVIKNPKAPELQFSIDIMKLTYMPRSESSNEMNQIRDRVMAYAEGSDARTLKLLMQFEKHEPTMISALCKQTQSPAVIWPCLQYDAKNLVENIEKLAALPVLTFSDAEQLAQVIRIAEEETKTKVLPGLSCRQVSSFAFDISEFGERDQSEILYPPTEVMIYHRLSQGAPEPVARCLLQKASAACLDSIHNRQICPLPFVFADFVRRLSSHDQEIVIDKLGSKGPLYRLIAELQRNYYGQIELVLFHLHLALAESLVKDRRAPTFERLSEYHVSRAWELWRTPGRWQHGNLFHEMLSPVLRARMCQRTPCASAACGPNWKDCQQRCLELVEPLQEHVCVN